MTPEKQETDPAARASAAEAEKRWAAIRGSRNIDDFRAFRRRYPYSPHTQEAAVIIQRLVRDERDIAPGGTARNGSAPDARALQPDVARTANSAASAASSTPANAGTGAGKVEVRVKVVPFGYVRIDGVEYAAAPLALRLSPGRHKFEARNDQENPPVISKTVDIAPQGTTDVVLRFME